MVESTTSRVVLTHFRSIGSSNHKEDFIPLYVILLTRFLSFLYVALRSRSKRESIRF